MKPARPTEHGRVAHSDEELQRLRREDREEGADIAVSLTPEAKRDRETREVAARFVEEELRALPGVAATQSIAQAATGIELPLTRRPTLAKEKRLTKPERLAHLGLGAVQAMADLVGVKTAPETALALTQHLTSLPVDTIVTELPAGPRILNLTSAIAQERTEESLENEDVPREVRAGRKRVR